MPAIADRTIDLRPRFSFVVERPHELLGLSACEADPVRIIEAARVRLGPLRASTGSHREVRFFAINQIVAARDAMLRNAADSGQASGRQRRLTFPERLPFA